MSGRLACVLAGVAVLVATVAPSLGLPTAHTTNAVPVSNDVPPMARRASHGKAAPALPQQSLVQSAQNYVDADGDIHVVDTSVRPARGKIGSTDHLKDDQFFLNIPFSEVEFNAVVDVTWVRPAAEMSKLDYVGLFQRDDLDDAIPCNWEFAEGEEGVGTTRLQMTNYGEMEIRYYDVAADRPRVKLPITVYPPCPNNCTNHGVCEKGSCVCLPPYKGDECCDVGGQIKIQTNVSTVLVGQAVHVTLTAPAGALDKRNWIGVFHANPDQAHGHNALVQTNQDAYPVFTDGTVNGEVETLNVTATPPLSWRYVDDELDLPMPYDAGEYVLRIVKNVVNDHPVLGSSSVIYVHNECPNKCSGHGQCVNGTCRCEEGFDHFADCSIGDGLVVLSASPTEGLIGTVVTVQWERNSDGPFSDLDFLALFDSADSSFDAPFAYQFAQPSDEKVEPVLERSPGAKPPKLVDRGTVEFAMPAAKGSFVVRYFRKDHVQFAASSNIEVYFDCTVPNCSGHGTCVKGECECEAGWKSADCSVGDGPITVSVDKRVGVVLSELQVEWSRPEKVGSSYDFVAVYDRAAANDQPYMYRYCHNDDGEDTHGSVTLQLPSKIGVYEVRYVDAFSRETQAISDSVEAHLPCPNQCSGHGTCDKDTCVCQKDWTARDDCSAKIGVTEMSASPLVLETPSNTSIVVVYKRPEGSGSAQDYIGLFARAETNNRHPLDFAMPEKDFGTVKFAVPHFAGTYQVRYIGGPDNELRAHTMDIDVSKACLNHCSDHGKCNRGLCECASGWGGLDCSIGQGPTLVSVGPKLGNPGDKLVITYTRPTNNGNANDFLAIYKKDQTDMSTPLAFAMATDKDHDSVETTMPSVEAELEVHYVKSDDQSSVGKSSPFKVVFPCKDDCHGHGDCKVGLCWCHAGFDGFACEKSVPTAFVLTAQSTTVEPQGTVTVAWEAIPKESSASDYIALYASEDTTNSAPVVYDYTALQPTGTASLMAPHVAGEYVAKYVCFRKGFAEIKAESDPIHVVVPPKSCPNNCSDHGSCNTVTGECMCDAGWSSSDCTVKVPTAWAVTADNTEYGEGHWVEVSWTRPPLNDGNYLDLVGIFETGPTRKLDAVQFQYPGAGNEGKLMFRAPEPNASRQTFELRFVNGANGKAEATSGLFDVVKGAGAQTAGKAVRRAHRV